MESNNEMYDVGDVVYFINPRDESVIPALVTEVIIRRRLNAETSASYVTNIISKGGIRSFEINPSEIELFKDADDVRDYMIQKTTKKIDEIVALAKKTASRLAGDDEKSLKEQLANQDEAEETFITLPDGTKARLKV